MNKEITDEKLLQTVKEDPQLKALVTIETILKPLDTETQKRILRTVAAFYELEIEGL